MTEAEAAVDRPHRSGRLARRLGIAFGFVLATVAVAALVVGALALRDVADEQRTQTECARATAFAAGLIASVSGNDRQVNKVGRNHVNLLFDRCAP